VTIHFAAPVRIEAAAAGKPRRLSIVGYGGGTMNVPSFGPIVVDLAGMKLPGSLPLLADHANAIASVIGSGTPTTDGKTLLVSGQVADTDAGRAVVALLESGTPLQASIGADPVERRPIPAGRSVAVNGRTIDGPFTLIVKSTLREMTITPLGADSSTSVQLAARRQGVSMKSFDEWVASLGLDPAAITDTQRDELQKAYDAMSEAAEEGAEEAAPANASAAWEGASILAENAPHLLARARRERWGVAKCNAAALESIRASRGSGPANANATNANGAAMSASHVEAAVMVRAGHEAAAVAAYGEQVVMQSRKLHRASFPDLLAAGMRAAGLTPPRDRDEMIRASLSGGEVAALLGNTANKVLESVWRTAPATWRSWCSVRSANDFKQHTSIRPTFAGALEALPEGGGIKHGTLGESTFTWGVHQFAKQYRLDRKAIINDDLSAFSEITPSLGKAALRALADLIYATLLANSGNFFHSSNGNVQTGGSSPLSSTSLATAVKQLRLQEDADGNALDIAPAVLVVPPAFEQTARGLLNSTEVLRDGSADLQPVGNTLQGLARLEVEARLENGCTSPVTGTTQAGSTTAWYLFGSPADVPMVVGFLRGKESPTVEVFGFNSDPNHLAMSFRVVHDFGASLGDYRAAQRSAGA